MQKLSMDFDLYNLYFSEQNDENMKILLQKYFEAGLMYNSLYEEYIRITNTRGWKLISFIRTLIVFLKKQNKLKITHKMKVSWQNRKDFCIPYQAFGMKKKDFDFQKKTLKILGENVKFSILVPLYNTPIVFLVEMIASVLGQSYSNWELCFADGSDCEHKQIQSICEEISRNDSRIKYKKLEKNLGISENTNVCLSMATGDYISLFDHDDLLHPAALYEVYCKILNEKCDFIYTDEATFLSPELHKIKFVYRKMDFSMEHLEQVNYICHFVSFKRDLLGDYLFDSKCDGAQDYDIVLWLTENAKKIGHVKKVLYFWRASPASTAFSSTAKSYTSLAGKYALEKHLKRNGENAIVLLTGSPNKYRILRKNDFVFSDKEQ